MEDAATNQFDVEETKVDNAATLEQMRLRRRWRIEDRDRKFLIKRELMKSVQCTTHSVRN